MAKCASRLEDPQSIHSPIQKKRLFICKCYQPFLFQTVLKVSFTSFISHFSHGSICVSFIQYETTLDFFHSFLLASNVSSILSLEPVVSVTVTYSSRFPSPKKEMITYFPIDYLTFFFFFDAPFPHDARDFVSISKSWLTFTVIWRGSSTSSRRSRQIWNLLA